MKRSPNTPSALPKPLIGGTRAFSLVELAIVLVILGLLTGGILAGQSLIRAAELRSVNTEYSRWVTAVQAFRDKYFALPGNITNATQFWGTAVNCPGNASQGSTTIATCNGNGDGYIWSFVSSNEPFRFWQHLANAGLIEGTYSGVTSNDVYQWTGAATNSPKSKLGNAIWQVGGGFDNSGGTFTGSYFNNPLGNFFSFGGPTSTVWNHNPVMKPEEAWNIDTKMDDGQPGRGKVTSIVAGGCNTATGGTDLNATYRLDNNAVSCMLAFIQAF